MAAPGCDAMDGEPWTAGAACGARTSSLVLGTTRGGKAWHPACSPPNPPPSSCSKPTIGQVGALQGELEATRRAATAAQNAEVQRLTAELQEQRQRAEQAIKVGVCGARVCANSAPRTPCACGYVCGARVWGVCVGRVCGACVEACVGSQGGHVCGMWDSGGA